MPGADTVAGGQVESVPPKADPAQPLLVVGDHPLIDGVIAAATLRHTRVTWLAADVTRPGVPGANLVSGPLSPSTAREHAAGAWRAIVAFTDEARQMSAIRALREGAPGLPITVNATLGWQGGRNTAFGMMAGVRVVSQLQLPVRDLHWRNPPPLIARRLGQDRVHALIFGFGRGGNAILSDLLLCSLTGFQPSPRITILDPSAEALRADLFRRCPELGESADIHFLDPGPVSDPRHLPEQALIRAHGECPVTLAHVSVDSDVRALSLARALHAFAGRRRWSMGPVCVRLGSNSGLPRLQVSHEPAELLGFGSHAEFVESLGLFDPGSDYLARLFHEAYRRTAKPGLPANRPWEDLDEEYRESNRRLLVHLPAKLLTAGVDLAAWLRIPLPRPNNMGGIPLPRLSPALLERLAELEHRRWMVDRRLSGWRHGPVRDNEARRHPDLIPYAGLDQYTKELDRAIVREAWETLGSARGSGFFAQGAEKRPI